MELMGQWEAAEELLATGVSVAAVWGFSSRVWYFYGNLKLDNEVEHFAIHQNPRKGGAQWLLHKSVKVYVIK